MTLEAPHVPEDGFGSLRSCLVEGDPLSEKRARRVKQRAVAVSIVLQTLALTTLVLFPLLSKGERISFKYATPIPPYARVGTHHGPTRPPGPYTPRPCHDCFRIISRIVLTPDPTPPGESDDTIGDQIPGTLPRDGVTGGNHPPPARPAAPPEENPRQIKERRNVSELQQMAQLIYRVEPAYPRLAIQIHREGRVELRAIISTEGTIESLEVLSGDPCFIQSALSAVRQWRYRPTILNGRPIEVDTHITVIYTLNH